MSEDGMDTLVEFSVWFFPDHAAGSHPTSTRRRSPRPPVRLSVSWPVGWFLILAAVSVYAQGPRTRTLHYDPQQGTWMELAPPLPGTPAGDLHVIREKIQNGAYREALKRCKRFEGKYGTEDPSYPELMIAQASAWIGLEKYQKADERLQEFLSSFAGMAITDEALRLEFIIAEAYLKGKRRRFWGLPLFSGVERAYEILDEISTDFPDSELAELAIKAKADHLFDIGEHALAELEYARMLREYPMSRYHRYALRRAADAALASFAGVDFDDAALVEAAERYREYRLLYPPYADREGVGLVLENIRERRAEKEFRIGQYYERTGHPRTAIMHYRAVLTNWGDTVAEGKARLRLELLGALHAQQPGGLEMDENGR